MRAGIAVKGGEPLDAVNVVDSVACAHACNHWAGRTQCVAWAFYQAAARERFRKQGQLRATSKVEDQTQGHCQLEGSGQLTYDTVGDGVTSGIMHHKYRKPIY